MTTKRKPARYGSGGIYQRGRVFWVRYRQVIRRPDAVIDYVQHRESTGSGDREHAEHFLRTRLQEIGGRRPTHVDPKKVSYEDLRQNFLERLDEKGLRSLRRTADGKATLDTLPRLDAFFGNWRASEITQAGVRRFRQDGKKDGLSDVRLNRYVATVRAMFRQAAKDQLITAKEMPAYFPMVKERNEGRGAILVEPGWYERLRKELKEPLRSAFVLAYHSGIRVGELGRLRWRNIDLKKRIATLPGAITKTGQSRVVFLPRDFDRNPGAPDDLVFPLGDDRDAWRAACVKVGGGWYECRKCGARCEGRICPTHGKRLLRAMRYR
ncbi:MAG TPA: tyrosine-type recombinase/integrase, partial [Candidatus Acidoferrales bacterium]|nr:tyrosine-type recombinase/integrase [Candidatus Acidoferrales bacterium]